MHPSYKPSYDLICDVYARDEYGIRLEVLFIVTFNIAITSNYLSISAWDFKEKYATVFWIRNIME